MDMNTSDYSIDKCNLDTQVLREEAVRRQLTNSQKEIPQYLQRIFERDQEERLKYSTDFYLQGILDKENRIELDVLLEQNKIQFTDESLDIVWFIVQHSTDCNWMMKWFENLLDKIPSIHF